MICLRCGYCCINLDVIIVDDPDKGKRANIVFVESNLKYKPSDEKCQHLIGETPGEYSCMLHDYSWYNKTPCFQYTQIGGSECRIGKHILEKYKAPFTDRPKEKK